MGSGWIEIPNGQSDRSSISEPAPGNNEILRLQGNTLTITDSSGTFGGTFNGGDSQSILFSGEIQDGIGGTLGVSADFTKASSVGQTAFISLSGQNTFTGPN